MSTRRYPGQLKLTEYNKFKLQIYLSKLPEIPVKGLFFSYFMTFCTCRLIIFERIPRGGLKFNNLGTVIT